ncbi:MAG TPA: ABC transporter permease [Candidatus Acidoferrales bacterium]|nr:ABC transporter permease [Candidatus Acidoferrales bacterium]
MSVAAYLEPAVSLDAGTRTAHADFSIRNDSAEIWRPGEGFAVGYHLFDAETGTLIVDGARVHPAHDLNPGDSERVHVDFEFPAEDGRYQVLVSPMRENVCWYYEQGWPFLLLEGSTRDGRSRVDRVRVVTRAALSRERALRALGRAFVLPVRTIWRNRGLIRVMVRRDILGRYRGSFGGAFWTVINPLLLMLTYFFVFGVFLRSRFGTDTSTSSFALYFLAGMLPWLAFSEAAGRAPTVMLEHRNFVKKLVFAVETLPVNLVAAGLVTEIFAVLLYCGFLVIARGTVPPTVFWLPVLLLPQLLFTAGIAWFLAGLGVFARDLGQIMGFVLTVWFFTTPICYPETQWPSSAAAILTKNPIYVLVRAYRAIFLEAHNPAFGSLWKLYLLSTAVFILGHAWFYKLRKSFPDML